MSSTDLIRSGTRVACIATAFALGLLSLTLAARAKAYVYWTNPAKGTISRADLDGTHVDPSFINGAADPFGVTVDAGHVYWTNYDTNTIGRAELDGTGADQSFITGARHPAGVAVDAGHVYWTNHDTHTIGRADLDGTGVDQGFITPAYAPVGIAVDARHVYWTSMLADPWASIGRADIDGAEVTPFFVFGAGHPTGVAVDARFVYWANIYEGAIGRVDTYGHTADLDFIGGIDSPGGVDVVATHVYWTNQGTSTIGRADLDGGSADHSFISTAGSPYGIAVDALITAPPADPPDTTAPETTISKGTPKRIGKSKAKFEFSSSEPDSTFECKLDKRAFKRCSSPKTVRRLGEGKHRFKVRAIDAAGNVDPSAAKDRFEVVGGAAAPRIGRTHRTKHRSHRGRAQGRT